MPRKTDSNNPADWLYLVECDLEALLAMGDQELGYSLCRGKAAEVLEKVIKAELIRCGWPLEKTHDLGKLHEWLRPHNPVMAAAAQQLCDDLAEAYFTDRYPGFDLDDPDWPKLRQQLREIEALAAQVQQRLPAKTT